MRIVAELAQEPAAQRVSGAAPLFAATLWLEDADSLVAGIRDYGDLYLTDIIEEMLHLASSDAHSARAIADRLLDRQPLELRSDSVDKLEEAMQIIANACQQMLGYVERARAFSGQRSFEIEPPAAD